MLTFENISLMIGALAVFGALVFFFAAETGRSYRMLGALLSLVAMMYALRYTLLIGHPAAPWLAWAAAGVAWFHAPCLEQYVRAAYYSDVGSVGPAFVPPAIVGGLSFTIYGGFFLSFEWLRKVEAMTAADSPFHDLMSFMLMSIVSFSVYYLWRMFQMARDYRRRYELYHAGESGKGVWEMYAVLALAVGWLSVPVLTEAALFLGLSSDKNFLAPTSAFALVPLLFLAFRRAVSSPERLPALEAEHSNREQANRRGVGAKAHANGAQANAGEIHSGQSRLASERLKEIAEKLREALEDDRIYLNEELSLVDLARELRESRHHLSEAIGAEFQTNFYGLINRYRVAEARELLRDTDLADESILNIAYRAGFRSKAVFNRTFKSETGRTPGEYRRLAS